jgi:hypothetical protein
MRGMPHAPCWICITIWTNAAWDFSSALGKYGLGKGHGSGGFLLLHMLTPCADEMGDLGLHLHDHVGRPHLAEGHYGHAADGHDGNVSARSAAFALPS